MVSLVVKDARTFAIDLLIAIEKDQSYANLEVPKQLNLSGFNSKDRARVTDLVMGTFRWKLLLETVIELAASREKTKIESDLLKLLTMACFELLFGKTAKGILVSEWVNIAKAILGKRATGFTNAVLRRVSERDFHSWQEAIKETHQGRLDLLWSHPQWIIDEYSKLITNADELENLLAANNSPPVTWSVETAIKNDFALSPTAINENLKNDETQEISNNPKRFQDAASQAAAYLLANFKIKDNEEAWLDTCAAPGGKSATMASFAPANTKIVSIDIHQHKRKLLESVLKNFPSSEILIADSRLKPWGERKFDRILIDAPCSGLGAIRRRAESRWKKSKNDLVSLIANAKEIFDASYRSLKPEGYLEYVVCSPIKAETDDFVNWALATFKDLRVVPPSEYIEIYEKSNPSKYVKLADQGLRFWPHQHQTDAMFIVLFQKLANT